MVHPTYKLTSLGHTALQKQLFLLKHQHRPQLLSHIGQPQVSANLKNISSYLTAQEAIDLLDYRIQELETIIENAEVIEITDFNQVTLGSRVTLQVQGYLVDYQIVSSWEADPRQFKISDTSPLGSALLEKQVGDQFFLEVPAGIQTYQVINIT